MRSDFVAACHMTKRAIEVPPTPLAAITAAALTVVARKPIKRLVAACCAALAALTMTGVALAFGGQIASAIKMFVSPGGRVTLRSQRFSGGPMTANRLRHLLSAVQYAVVLPMGLPRESRLGNVLSLSANGSTGDVVLTYNYPVEESGNAMRDFSVLITPANAQVTSVKPGVSASTPQVGPRSTLSFGPNSKILAHWGDGAEAVWVVGPGINRQQIERMRRAMNASTPEASFGATVPILGDIYVIGNPSTLHEVWDQLPPAQYPTLVDGQIVSALARFMAANPKVAAQNSSIYITHAAAENPVLSLSSPTVTLHRDGGARPSEKFQWTGPQTVRIIESLALPKPANYDYLISLRLDLGVARVRVLPRTHENATVGEREYVVDLKSMTARQVHPR